MGGAHVRKENVVVFEVKVWLFIGRQCYWLSLDLKLTQCVKFASAKFILWLLNSSRHMLESQAVFVGRSFKRPKTEPQQKAGK